MPTLEAGARAVPSISSGFTDSHYFREAYGNVAYGFMPKRTDPLETWPLVHSATSGWPRTTSSWPPKFFLHAARTIGELRMTRDHSETRCGWAGWRCETASWCTASTTGRPPCALPQARSGWRRGESPTCPSALVGTPVVRGVARMAEVAYLLPTLRRRLPEARLPFEAPGMGAALAASALISTVARRSKLPVVAAEAVAVGMSLVPA